MNLRLIYVFWKKKKKCKKKGVKRKVKLQNFMQREKPIEPGVYDCKHQIQKVHVVFSWQHFNLGNELKIYIYK